MPMLRRNQIGLAVLLATAANLGLATTLPAPNATAPLTDAQIHDLVQRAIAMQHRSDDAIDLYDRTERIIKRDGDEKQTNVTARTVPVGTTDLRVELDRDGQPVPPDEVAQKWREVIDALQVRTNAANPAVKKDYEKAAKHREYSSKMLDAIADAFLFHYAGRSVRNGRPVIELDYEPNPNFEPTLRYSSAYKHVYGKAWVDEESGAVVRLEAELRRDISVGAGIIGKIYKGATVEIEQAEPEPGAGVWLPTLTAYDVEGRKFVFPASFHRKFYASDYRRIGPPAEALPLLRREHANLFATQKGEEASASTPERSHAAQGAY